MTPTTDPLLRELGEAAEGLVYSSETDRPFEPFFLAGGGARWPVGAPEFAALLGKPPGARVEERSLDRFLARHLETSDPYDTRAQQVRPRYEALKALLLARLREVRVFRLGEIEVRCYVVGGDGRGNLAGLSTVAVET
ncbi:MAG TPA: nuclease A inhibitor family protein [Longimicrobiaceae bacterium]|nr:nuclease A inhibitor family protein [Longimicrobiaceae bacterium]